MGHRHSVTDEPLKLVGIAAIAAAVGAAVAVLLTPRSGSQLRGGLKRRANNLKDDMRDHLVKTIDESEDDAEEVKRRLQSTASKVADDTKSTARKVSRDAKVTGSRAKTTAKKATKPRNSRS